MVRQLGFDHSHIEVWGANHCLTRTAMPQEWSLASCFLSDYSIVLVSLLLDIGFHSQVGLCDANDIQVMGKIGKIGMLHLRVPYTICYRACKSRNWLAIIHHFNGHFR